MIIRTKVKVTTRTPDGRPWSAAEGITSEIDDGDTVLVAHMRRLAKLGQVKILEQVEKITPPDPGQSPAGSAEVKARTPDAELDQLREQAVATGITVDRRWGAARLREEIDAAVLAEQPEVSG